ncbi:GDSL-type esterase/lipase family protein [Oryzibacter oryziterrae]|uniref:GDSL-type esterase/lipase family protein n=1 Tax=Oryzibacter oryziterrae TaxID=2766474 RepID=UPI001F4712E8|nr:GDSL-type esterase/lipase family protein [Oryzibacter oryziterrae]
MRSGVCWLTVLACFFLAGGSGLTRAAEPNACDPLALDLTLTSARTPLYASLRETVKVQAAVPSDADVVFVGDSLLAGWRTDLPSAFPNTRSYDFAVGGDRVPNVLWRLENTDLTHLSPASAVLLIGTNDLAAGTPACAVARGIEQLVQRLQDLWPRTRVFVLTIPPRGPDFRDLDVVRHEVNTAIGALPQGHPNVFPVVIDDTAFTCGAYAKPPLDAGQRSTPYRCDLYTDDNLHFTPKGYLELGAILQRASQSATGQNAFQ